MAALTTAQRDRITLLIRYLDQGSAGNSDAKVGEELARIFGGTCGFGCGCPGDFLEGYRDAQTSTLLKVILCVDSAAI